MQQQSGVTFADATRIKWRALHTLKLNAERAELRAAGVPERTIDTLYPPRFEDLVPGLTKLLSAAYLQEVGRYEDWATITSASKRVRGYLGEAYYRLLNAALTDFWESECARTLLSHLHTNLPGRQSQGRAPSIVNKLFEAHWLMAQPELSVPLIDAYCSAVFDWALPNLTERVAPQVTLPDFVLAG